MSRPEQLRGDSLRRQQEAERWAEELGLTLDETLRDLGLSAYSGAHREKGTLGAYLRMVERGQIPRGKVLMVESFDRLSRQMVVDALAQFMALMQAGIIIATSADRKIYSRETIGDDWTQLIISLTIMSRAHEESAMKAKRLRAVWEKKRQEAHIKPMTARGPGWLKLEDGEWKTIDERVALVLRMYQEAIRGFGEYRITARLNRDGIPAFQGKGGWHKSSVRKILSSEAVLGTFQPHRKVDSKRVPDGPPRLNYFPAIIDEATFWRAQEAIKSRQHVAAGRKGEADTNLFSGIGICGQCHIGKLHLVNKGSPPKGAKYLTCQRASRGLCTNHAHYPYDRLEEWLLHTRPGVMTLMAHERSEELTDTAVRVAELEAMLARRNNDRKRFVDAFRNDDDPMLIDAIRQLGLEVKLIEAELTKARKEAKTIEHADRQGFCERVIEAIELMRSKDLNKRQAARAKLAQAFRSRIDVITLHRDHRLTVRIKQDGWILEKELSREGWVRSNVIWPDGTVLRIPIVLLGAAQQVECEFERQGKNLEGMVSRLGKRQVGEREYEVMFPPIESARWRSIFGLRREPI